MLLYIYETDGRKERKEGRRGEGRRGEPSERKRARRGSLRLWVEGWKEGAWGGRKKKVVRTSTFVLRDIGNEDGDREARDQSNLRAMNEGRKKSA